MAELLTVGEFSRLTHLTVKALHHYHQVGVLEPALIDPFTGYRYYSAHQVEVAHLVRRLREVRMPVPQVRAVLAAPDGPARIAEISAHLDRLRRELTETAAAVASLQSLLTSGATAPTVSYRDAAEQRCVALTAEVDRDGITPWCAQAYPRLYAGAGRLALPVTGPGGALYDGTWFESGRGRVTAFVPIGSHLPAGATTPAAADGRAMGDTDVRLVTLPGQRLAVAQHCGPFADLDRTYGTLGRHVLETGLCADGPIREIYLVTPADTDDPQGLRTDVCWPVTPDTPTPKEN
jgi:DNA-binding transcriptional MerR regulator